MNKKRQFFQYNLRRDIDIKMQIASDLHETSRKMEQEIDGFTKKLVKEILEKEILEKEILENEK